MAAAICCKFLQLYEEKNHPCLSSILFSFSQSIPSAMIPTEIVITGREEENVAGIRATCSSTAREVAINAKTFLVLAL